MVPYLDRHSAYEHHKILLNWELQKIEKMEEIAREKRLLKTLRFDPDEDALRKAFWITQTSLRRQILNLELEKIESNRLEARRLYLKAKEVEEKACTDPPEPPKDEILATPV